MTRATGNSELQNNSKKLLAELELIDKLVVAESYESTKVIKFLWGLPACSKQWVLRTDYIPTKPELN